MTSKLKTDILETVSGSGTIALTNQLSGMTSASMPSGSVLQVVSGTFGTNTSTTSTSFVNTPVALSITPTSTSSKILIMVSAPMYAANANTYAARFTIFRGTVSGVNLGDSSLGFGNQWSSTGGTSLSVTASMSFLDSPSTTSSQAYTVGIRSEGNNSAATIMQSNAKATITLMEIKG